MDRSKTSEISGSCSTSGTTASSRSTSDDTIVVSTSHSIAIAAPAIKTSLNPLKADRISAITNNGCTEFEAHMIGSFCVACRTIEMPWYVHGFVSTCLGLAESTRAI